MDVYNSQDWSIINDTPMTSNDVKALTLKIRQQAVKNHISLSKLEKYKLKYTIEMEVFEKLNNMIIEYKENYDEIREQVKIQQKELRSILNDLQSIKTKSTTLDHIIKEANNLLNDQRSPINTVDIISQQQDNANDKEKKEEEELHHEEVLMNISDHEKVVSEQQQDESEEEEEEEEKCI